MSVITITGKVLLPGSGPPIGGHIIATLSANATESANRIVGRRVFDVPDGGDLALADPAVQLDGNDGLTPADTYYNIDYLLRDRKGAVHPFRERWQLSGSGSQDIGDINPLDPVPVLGHDFGEHFDQAPGVPTNGQVWAWNSAASKWMLTTISSADEVTSEGASLPSPSISYHRKLRHIKEAGLPGAVYVCLENFDSTVYTWKQLADGEP